MSTLRIGIDAHVVGQQQTGNETYVRNLVENLSSLAHPEHEYYFYHTQPLPSAITTSWRGSVKRVRPHNPLLRIPFAYPWVLKRDRVKLAHFQYVMPPVLSCKTIVTIHDISYEYLPDCFNPIERKRMQLLIPYSARRCDHVVTISEYSKQQIMECYKIPEEKISVIYNGVSANFQVLEATFAQAAVKPYKINGPYILGVGNLQPRKNLQRLMEAFLALKRQENIPHKLVLVGKQAYKGSEIFNFVKTSGLEADVIFTGYVNNDDLVALYNCAEIFVYPSLYEGFGLPVIEAMACGTPVVVSNTSSLPEVAGDAAMLIDPYNTQEIANGILKVLQDPSLKQELIKRGFQQSAKFSWMRLATEMAQIYSRYS